MKGENWSLMRYFCTYFDQHYLPRGLVLYRSLREHCPEFKLWVLCMDQVAFDMLTQLDLPEVHPIALADFEENDADLRAAKQNRSTIEYYFTCTPSLPLYILNQWPEADLITYVDADLFFFSNPQPLFNELKKGSIGIIAHRFPPGLERLAIHGIYNVGWLMFRRDEHGIACLQWWRERCIEWCYDRLEGDRFADQKYLDDWPERFQGVIVLAHKGANLAPWNVANYHLRYQAQTDTILVDEQPLIFFHFHGLKRLQTWLYDPNLNAYRVTSTRLLRTKIYGPYINVLLEAQNEVAHFSTHHPRSDGIRLPARNVADTHWALQLGMKARRSAVMIVRTLLGRHLFFVRGHVM